MSTDPWRALGVAFRHVLPRAALLYVLAGCSIHHMNAGLVYYPDRNVDADPGRIGLAFEDLWLTTADGLKIAAWHVPARDARGTVLFCHGNAGNMSHRLETIQLLHRLGVDVLIFDYRGYGRSEGKPREKGTYLDAEAAWNYLTETRRVPPGRIVIHGRSLGGSVAAHLAQGRPAAGLVLESTFHDITELGAELFPWLPVRWISWMKYKTADYVRNARCPVMVIHSRDDDMIPFHHGRKVFDAAGEPKRFLETRGAHNTAFFDSQAVYEPALRQFLDDVLGRP